MNVSQLKNHIKQNIAREDKDALMLDWINGVITKLATRYNYAWMRKTYFVATTAGTREYNLPSDFKEISQIRFTDTTSYKIEPISDTDLASKYTDSSSGRPLHYAPIVISDTTQKLSFYPNPDATYNLEVSYFAFPIELTDGADTNLFTVKVPMLIIYGATADALYHLNELERGRFWDMRFETEAKILLMKDINIGISRVPEMKAVSI